MASDSDSRSGRDEEPLGPRVSGRHAAPRTTVRQRFQLPVGRALALTAVPTALLMATITPKLALAADARSTTASSSPEKAVAGPQGGACTKSSLQALEQGTAPTAKGTTVGGGTGPGPTKSDQAASVPTTASHSVSTTAGTTVGTTAPTTAPAPTASTPAGAPKSPQPRSLPTAAPTTAPTTGPGSAQPSNPVLGLLNGLGGLLGLDVQAPHGAAAPTPSASPSASASAAPVTSREASAVTRAVPAPATKSTPAKPTTQPTATASHSSSPVTGKPTGKPTATTPTTTQPTTQKTTPAAAPGSAAAANKLCDISNLAAPLDTSVINGITEMPSVPWTLKSSNLELINTQFWGVVTVPTAAGDVRVLKFTAQEVNIGDLDMSTQQIGQDLHVQGGPGTTSTMRGGTVTMYVTSLSGTLNAAEGIPLGWLGINLTLTPDTLPQWLYDLIGDIPIPLTLDLTNAVATQAGQFGGDLTIPGMHLYYTPLT